MRNCGKTNVIRKTISKTFAKMVFNRYLCRYNVKLKTIKL